MKRLGLPRKKKNKVPEKNSNCFFFIFKSFGLLKGFQGMLYFQIPGEPCTGCRKEGKEGTHRSVGQGKAEGRRRGESSRGFRKVGNNNQMELVDRLTGKTSHKHQPFSNSERGSRPCQMASYFFKGFLRALCMTKQKKKFFD